MCVLPELLETWLKALWRSDVLWFVSTWIFLQNHKIGGPASEFASNFEAALGFSW